MGWFNRNKAKIGMVLGAVAAVAGQIGEPHIGLVLGGISSFLIGGGAVESDRHHKDKEEGF